jgi:hypothetical protein
MATCLAGGLTPLGCTPTAEPPKPIVEASSSTPPSVSPVVTSNAKGEPIKDVKQLRKLAHP